MRASSHSSDAPPMDGGPSHVHEIVGATLGQTYRVDAPLTHGGMGDLYAGTHLRLQTPVVVKVLRARYSEHAVARERFVREARAACVISSPHVLRALDLVETSDGRPAIVSEHLVGEDLQQHLNRRPEVSAAAALDVIGQALVGLRDAHAAGVLHRDIKPSNLFLSPGEGSPRVRILDFGVAKVRDSAEITKAGAVVGTPAYMAPEQASGRRVDARADIYAVGAVLYRMVTGRPPYTGDSTAVIARVLEGAPRPVHSIAPAVPQPIVDLIERAMARAPEDRFPSAQAMLDAVRAATSELPEDATIRTRPSLRSHHRAMARALAGATAVAVTTVALLGSAFELDAVPRSLTATMLTGALVGVTLAATARALFVRRLDSRALYLFGRRRLRLATALLSAIGGGTLIALLGPWPVDSIASAAPLLALGVAVHELHALRGMRPRRSDDSPASALEPA